MFERILIANRGEIAVRVARTATAMGIETVGLYSEPDRDAAHTDAVDVAVALPGSAPADTYLRGDAVIAAALDTGAQAVHPGYGFLSENAVFAQSVLDAGLFWIGPTPEQIALLGDKVAAKRAALAAKVPTTPLYEVTDGVPPDDLLTMPVLVKAAAGGGGRGMRIVREYSHLRQAVEEASREAAAAFGDGTVFIEPFVERGRHIEVQIMGDAHGNVIHLGERECSIQRRNQKVVEESPSAGIDLETRNILCEGALALARHVSYQNAGTVEFLVGPDGTVSFLEVNTRLQVEHPVTEAVTGLDLVELQLRVAAGEPLPLRQDDVHIKGHAIEVRLVAEDPAAGWVPSTGLITAFDIPDSVRCDSGFRVGSEVSSSYDSLLAKVISFASTRESAARRLAAALRRSRIAGPRTNLDCLAAILTEPDFLAARTPTTYLLEHPDVEKATEPHDTTRDARLVAAGLVHERRAREDDGIWGFAPSGWRVYAAQAQPTTWVDRGTGEEHHLELLASGAGRYTCKQGAPPNIADTGAPEPDMRRGQAVRLLSYRDGAPALEIDGKRWRFDLTEADGTVHVSGTRGQASYQLQPKFLDDAATTADLGPVAPLPGTVIAVHVSQGDLVTAGDALLVLEAMKMEHTVRAGADARVAEVRFAIGDRVDVGDVLLLLDNDVQS